MEHWPSGIRDTAEWPTIDINIDREFRGHLENFLAMDGVGWRSYDEQRAAAETTIADSRLRTYRKMYERLGLIHKESEEIRLTSFALDLVEIEKRLNSERDELIQNLRERAARILSRYQFVNPSDNFSSEEIDNECDLRPVSAIWMAMSQLDGKLHQEELNRCLLRTTRMDQIPGAIQRIRSARNICGGDYTQADLNEILGAQVNDNQPSARMAAWFSLAGWGGLIIEQHVDDDGFRNFTEEALPLVKRALEELDEFRTFATEEEWFSYFLGNEIKAHLGTETLTPDIVVSLTNDLNSVSLRINSQTTKRLFASLLAKNFLILTGLSGSGKTKVAQGLSTWLNETASASVVVPVGADWTSREQMLGYHDGINPERYVQQATLRLILEARGNPERPHFLILDEMNLSHVERYFSDFLSAIESGDEIPMHENADGVDGVPSRIGIPDNLFVIGTVNVDETTYMFSPKVLDRANVIEFRVSVDGFTEFLEDPKRINLNNIAGNGAAYGPAVVSASQLDIDRALLDSVNGQLPDGSNGSCYPALRAELEVLFRIFQSFDWDFGFRVGNEVSRFIYFHQQLSGADWKLDDALDAQVIQKLMPKLNGSEGRLNNILKALAWYCSGREGELHEDNSLDGKTAEERAKAILKKVEDSTADDPKSIFTGLTPDANGNKGKYPLSMEKTARMWNAVKTNGFTSFAEN